MPGPELQTSEPLHVTDVTEANGWYTITTDGRPQKLKTNRQEGGQAAGRFKLDRSLVVVQYAEKDGNINPHTGVPYHDIYWYAGKVVEQASQNGSDDDGITRVKAQSPEKTPEEAWRIALSVGTERAVALAPHLPQDRQDFPFIWALAYEFAARIFLTPPPKPGSLDPLPVGGDAGPGPDSYELPPPPRDDDDIPF